MATISGSAAAVSAFSLQLSVEQRPLTFSSTAGKDITHGVDLGREGMTIRVGHQVLHLTGYFARGQDLVDAINALSDTSLTASLDSRGNLRLDALQPIVIGGRGAGRMGVNIGGSDPSIYRTPVANGGTTTTVNLQMSFLQVTAAQWRTPALDSSGLLDQLL